MTWPTTAARGDEDNFFAFSVGLGWVGMGWRRGHGVLPKESLRVFFFFYDSYIFSLSVLVAFQRVPQPMV